MYLQLKKSNSLLSDSDTSFGNFDFAPQSIPSDWMTSTFLSSPLEGSLGDLSYGYGIAPVSFAPTPAYMNGVQNALATFDGHLATLETGVETVRTGVVAARETAEDIASALGIFGDIEDGADAVADIMGGFRKVLTIVGQVPALRSVARRLDDVFEALIDKVREIEAKAKKIDEDLEPAQDAVDDAISRLEGFELILDDADALLSSVRDSVSTANSVYDEIEDFSFTDPDTGDVTDFMSVLNGINAAFSPANANFGDINGFLSTANDLVIDVNDVFSAADPFLAQARAYGAQIASIRADLSFLERPMAVLNSALSPIADLLSAVGIIFDLVVSPILDPILEAIGVNRIFDEIIDALAAPFDNLPDLTAIGDGIADIIENLVPDVGVSFIDEITNPLNNFIGDLGSRFIDVVTEITPGEDEVFLIEEGQIALDGGTGNDLISGNDLSNVINGLAGDDVITPGRGDDIVDGGAGTDAVIIDGTLGQYSYTRETATEVVLDHINPNSSAVDQGRDSFSNIEFFVFSDGLALTAEQLDEVVFLTQGGSFDGTEGVDFVIGDTSTTNNFSNIIRGLGGDDYLNGGTGADVLFGGIGDDTLAGGGNDGVNIDIIDGGAGNDTASFADLTGPIGLILLDDAERAANAGLTLFLNQLGEEAIIVDVERIVGTDGNDYIYGNFDDNIFIGGEGSDVIRGLLGDDVLEGEEGQDFLFGDIGDDVLIAGAGDDYLTSGYGNDTLEGGEGYDTLFYGATIVPTELVTVLADTLYRNIGSQEMSGETDYIIFNGENQTVEEYNSTGELVGTDIISGIERIYGGNGDNRFTGTNESEVVIGGEGDDVIRLNGSQTTDVLLGDRFFAAGGDDTVYLSGVGSEYGNLGDGTNFIIYDNSGELTQDYRIQINRLAGETTVDFSASAYALESGAQAGTFQFAQTFDVTGEIILADGLSEFVATDFDDVLVFRFTADRIYAGDGNDFIAAPEGATSLLSTTYGGNGDDTYRAATNFAGNFFGEAGNDLYRGSRDSRDSIFFTFNGGEGDDLLRVGGSNETFIGGDGSDTVSFANGWIDYFTGITVDLSLTGIQSNPFGGQLDLSSSVENVITGDYNDVVTGNNDSNELVTLDGDDTVFGLFGNDVIYAGRGDDYIDGGFGNDLLSGGMGNNTIIGGANIDTVLLGFNFTVIRDPLYYLGSQYRDDVHADTTVTADLLDDASGPGFGRALMEVNGDIEVTSLHGVENITAANLNDDLRGDHGGNALVGAGGNDLLMGRGGNDSLAGGIGDDVLIGGAGDDVLAPGRGQDRLYGGLGDDYVALISGDIDIVADLTLGELERSYSFEVPVWADTQTSEARALQVPTDSIIPATTLMLTPLQVYETSFVQANSADDLERLYSPLTMEALDAASEGNFALNFETVTEQSLITLSSIENLAGGAGNDQITGTSGDNVLDGYGGNDVLRGGLGNDTLTGGEGDDHLIGDDGGALADFGFVNLNFGGQDILPGAQGFGGSISDFLEVQNLTSIGTETFTIEMLYQASEVYDDDGALLSYAVAGTGDEIMIYSDGGMLEIKVNNVLYETGVDANDILHDGALHRLSLTYELFPNNIGEVRVYVDGELEYSGSRSNSAITTGGRLIIGQEQDNFDSNAEFNSQQILSGRVSDIRIFDDVRTTAEIADNAYALIDPATQGLVENWVITDALTNVAGSAAMTLSGGVLTLVGEAGDDILDGGAGADILDGQEGFDLASYESFMRDGEAGQSGLRVSLSDLSQNTGDAIGDVFISIEGLIGSRWDDELTGDDGDNALYGGAGDDILRGGLGGDILDGEGQNPGYSGDIADYAESNAAISINLQAGTASGGHAEGDVLSNIESLIGTDFDDVLIGDFNRNFLAGFGGADFIDGGGGFDYVDYRVSTEAVTINLATGQGSGGHAQGDIIANFEGILGSQYDDVLIGSDVLNDLVGGEGDDLLIGGAGQDVLNGGLGNDTISYIDSNEGVIVRLFVVGEDEGTINFGGTAMRDIIFDVENLTGSSFRDLLYGDNGENVLIGMSGNDSLSGRGGDDILHGGDGNDRLYGGDGIDTALYSDANAGITINLALTTIQDTVGAGSDTLSGIENILGSSFDDMLSGSAGFNRLDGGAGDDALFGGTGSDTLIGGYGNDIIDGWTGFDTALYTALATGVTVDLDIATAQDTGGGGVDTLLRIENLVGSGHDDFLFGSANRNRIEGGNGIDVIDGRGGNDTLIGGAGNDILIGGTGADRLVGGSGRDDLFGGGQRDRLEGGSGHDDLFGGDDVDRLLGGDGNDLLVGGRGTDFLFGGSGADRFDFNSLNDSGVGPYQRDEIRDFSSAEGDRIDVFGIDADATMAGNQAFVFAEDGFTGVAGQMQIESFVRSGVNVQLVSFDVDGDAEADMQIWVLANELDASDFVL